MTSTNMFELQFGRTVQVGRDKFSFSITEKYDGSTWTFEKASEDIIEKVDQVVEARIQNIRNKGDGEFQDIVQTVGNERPVVNFRGH